MKVLLGVTLLTILYLLTGLSALSKEKLAAHVSINNKLIKILYRKLISECPSYDRSRRALLTSGRLTQHTKVQKLLYDSLFQDLIKCRSIKVSNPPSTQKLNATTAPTSTNKQINAATTRRLINKTTLRIKLTTPATTTQRKTKADDFKH